MKVDYIIVGQGLAGSILSYELLKNNKKVLLIDNNSANSSSKIAAGIMNPVTGRKMVKTWMADTLFPLAHQYYPQLEKELKSSFFYPLPILNLLTSVKETNDLFAKLGEPEMAPWAELYSTQKLPEHVKQPLGFIELKQGGWCDVPKLLEVTSSLFKAQGLMREENFEYKNLNQTATGWTYGEVEAGGVIFCEGSLAQKNPWFSYLPITPAKGEILTIRSTEFKISQLLKKYFWVLPIGNDLYKLGATFEHQFENELTSNKAKTDLSNWLQELTEVPFEIINHQAGIRPTTFDRRTLLGEHPKYKGLFIFNGLGTKGVSLIPWLTSLFVPFLLHNKPLPHETRIERLTNRYFK